MTPDARLKATIELLGFIGISPVPMDTTIADYMRARRYIGSKDRANIADRLYGMMRAHARLGWWLEQSHMPADPRTRLIAWLVLEERSKALETITPLFGGGKYAPEALTDREKKMIEALSGKSLDDPAMPEAVRAECPPLYEEKLRTYFGADFVPEMQAMLAPATLDIRVYLSKQNREEVQTALYKDSVPTDFTPYAASGLRAKDKAFLSKTKAFVKGWIDIQDEGSQLIAELCAAQPGMQVLDLCAGAGGKTLALADAMKNKGRIVAMDIDGRRLEKARPRFRRAGVHDIIEIRPLDEDKGRKWLKRQKGTFDLVLTDVPCTGTGTWRRNPDTRWRVYGPALEELIPVQAEILERAARAVKPGGRLVYATCSLLAEENERQIETFLAAHPDFSLQNLDLAYAKGPYMRLTPLRHGTDGFFGAVLQRHAQI